MGDALFLVDVESHCACDDTRNEVLLIGLCRSRDGCLGKDVFEFDNLEGFTVG